MEYEILYVVNYITLLSLDLKLKSSTTFQKDTKTFVIP